MWNQNNSELKQQDLSNDSKDTQLELMQEANEHPAEVNTMSNDVKNDEIENVRAELEKLREQCHMDQSVFDAIDRIRAVVEFDMQGNILTTNQIFLEMMGYSSEQLAGKHHSKFVSGEYSNSTEYKEFWAKLNRGEIDAGQYKFINSQGHDVWLQAYYAPVNNIEGSLEKVIIYATDITEQKLKNADYEGQMAAIDKSQGVIEFNMDGTVITANQNFLSVLGYSLEEIKGKHHSMFATPEVANSLEYKQFWEKLNRGEFDSGEYQRFGKGGKEIWIQASYNPIMDLNGKPFKVVKYASDITQQKLKNADYEGQMAAIDKSQGVIEFNMDGTVVWANDNFLSVLGYSLEEIKGKHHSMFATPEVANSLEYKQFWEKLNRGEFDSGEYQRFGKGGKEIWIQASYNPIMDLNGKPIKVVKYATEITAQKLYQKNVVNVLSEVSKTMEKVSNGDLTDTIEDDFGPEFNEVRDTVNSTVQNLFNMVNEIRNSSGNINISAQEIAQGNTDLSARTEQQASALEETASTVEEMTSTVRQNADNAKQANQLASNAKDTAEKGGSVVNNAVSAMSEINTSSKKIADIIGVIDEIAFQTNLLALNAAVEAARAGEQGRGFAVVASEVRNLAQRSAAAAKEIKTLINDSVDKVEEGSKLVDESGQTLEEIVISVKKVSDIIAEIAAAGEEQYVGIEQINKAVGEMDNMTQQNAALVEEAAAASQAMSEQSQSLNKLVSQFNIGESKIETDSYQHEERRSENRPWNNTSANTPSQSPAQSYQPKKVAAAGGDDEWEEF